MFWEEKEDRCNINHTNHWMPIGEKCEAENIKLQKQNTCNTIE